VVAVVGVAPLWQPLVAGPYGREQAFDQAWDPARSEWFGVFDPAPAPGTWGHWTGRGMTANSQCAPCHDTHVDRGWDDASATCTTTVSERGVGCEACHGRASAHAADPKVPVPTVSPSTESCLPCHSRRTALTASSDAPGAGETFLDRFRPVGLDDTSAFWPDGQVRDEVFEGESFLSSRMAAVGVRCVDCHDAHTGRTVREGDALCLGCHDRLPGFVRHDHHAEGSEGARCTACHMPTKVFMQRDVRHDHGFTIPDPGLGVEAGVPDACTSCHKDRDPAWAAAALEAWFGNTLRPSAVRARAFVRAETDPADLVAVAAADDHPWWRARALARLGAAGGDAQRAAFFDPAAIIRLGAVTGLAEAPRSTARDGALRRALGDAVRAVRVAAARGLRRTLDPDEPLAEPLRTYLAANADQPEAALELGRWWLERGRADLARTPLERAVAWDGARVEARLHRAFAALRLGDTGLARTELEAVTRAEPELAEGWLALSRLHQEGDDLEEALATLRAGEAASPRDPRLPLALARLLAEAGRPAAPRRAEARARALTGP
jgi:predicted CXXCH cytochrome family protein